MCELVVRGDDGKQQRAVYVEEYCFISVGHVGFVLDPVARMMCGKTQRSVYPFGPAYLRGRYHAANWDQSYSDDPVFAHQCLCGSLDAILRGMTCIHAYIRLSTTLVWRLERPYGEQQR